MTDLENELRDLLRAKADALPSQRSVPRPMVRRARRRAAATALSGMMVAAALVVAGLSGVRALTGSRVQVGHTPTPSVAHVPTPGTSATTPQLTDIVCHADVLEADFQRKEGAIYGSLVVTNTGSAACSISGTLTVTLLGAAGDPLETQSRPADPWWKVRSQPPPSGWPVVRLEPGQSAKIRLAMRNWCTEFPSSWQLSFPGDGTLRVRRLPGVFFVQCTDASQPSTVEIGPVEPAD